MGGNRARSRIMLTFFLLLKFGVLRFDLRKPEEEMERWSDGGTEGNIHIFNYSKGPCVY